MSARKTYNQNCPIALGLDVLGDRWTLLILRELVGGPRRYSDLRGQLPGIATNLLTDRLRDLEEAGIIERSELPPPAARTVYSLSEAGWSKVPPVLRAIASFGLELLEPTESAFTPVNAFLAGVLMGFNADRAVGLTPSYRLDVDGRRFDFGVGNAGLTAAQGPPAVIVTATAADLITSRLGSTAAERKAALRRITFDGDEDAVELMQYLFSWSA